MTGSDSSLLERTAGAAAELLPASETEAQIEAAFLPFGFAAPAARGAGRLAGRATARRAAREAGEEGALAGARRAGTRGPLGEAVETSAPRVTRETTESAARRQATRRAGREAAEEGGEGLTRQAGREAAEEGGEGFFRRTAGRAGGLIRRNPGKAAAVAGGTGLVAGALIASRGDDGGSETTGDGGPADDPFNLPPGQAPPGSAPPPGAPGAPGTGPFAPTGAGPLQLGFLDRIGGGLGAALDRIGGGIADTLRSLGVPIGEGAGKAIAVGGTLILIAIAVREGVGPFTNGGGGPSGSTSSSSSSGSTPPRGPDGKFVSSGGS